jgi:hypothetical protein
MAQVLSISEAKGAADQSLVERLQAHLCKKQLLLLLDNFEYVISAASLMVFPGPVPGLVRGLEGVKQATGMYRSAFPNFTVTVEDLIAKGVLTSLPGGHEVHCQKQQGLIRECLWASPRPANGYTWAGSTSSATNRLVILYSNKRYAIFCLCNWSLIPQF